MRCVYVVRGTLPGMNKPTVLKAHSPADLLAAVPLVLGFPPEESLVTLAVRGGPNTCHARIDLPTNPGDVDEAVDSLVWAALTNHVDQVVVIAYTSDRAAAARAADALAFALAGGGVDVVEMLRVDRDRFWSLWPDDRDCSEPSRFDAQSHRFRAEAVLRGRVVHASRAELAATLAPEPSPAVAEEVARLEAEPGHLEELEPWLLTGLRGLARSGPPSPADTAGLLVALTDPELMDSAVLAMSHGEAVEWVALWRHLIRCAPDSHASGPAALLAFAAWRSGDGALAWCAVDRCLDLDPGNLLAGMVAGLLEHAVPPSAWA